MKRLLAICVVMLFVALVHAQSTEERKLQPFDKLDVAGDVKVFLTRSSEEEVKIVAINIEVADIITTIEGKTLKIELSRGIHKDASVEVWVSYKEMRDITVSSSGRLSMQNSLDGDKVVLNANTNGEIDAELNLATVDVTVNNGGTIRLSGKTGSVDAKVSTKGILSALELKSDSTYVQVGTAGIAKVFAANLLDANVKFGATLTYSGSPKQKSIKSGIGATVNEIEL